MRVKTTPLEEMTLTQDLLKDPTTLRIILDAADIPINYCSAEKKFLFVNKTYAQWYGLTPEQIIAKFGKREAAFAKARDEYTFRQTVKIDTIDDARNKPDGEYQQVTDIVFSDDGARTEHVIFAPANTIEKVIMSQADFDDIQKRLPFVLTTPELPSTTSPPSAGRRSTISTPTSSTASLRNWSRASATSRARCGSTSSS